MQQIRARLASRSGASAIAVIALAGMVSGCTRSPDSVATFDDGSGNPNPNGDDSGGTTTVDVSSTSNPTVSETTNEPVETSGTGAVDTTNGMPDPAECGNGSLEVGESCDGEDFGGASCADQGFESGSLVCTDNCQIVTTGCSTCGDGMRSGEEDCEGDDLGDGSCETEGFEDGDLWCNDDCTYDVSACSTCGDGVKNGNEDCDGDDLAGATCESEGYAGGVLACSSQCNYDEAGCLQTCNPTGTPCSQPGQCCAWGCGLMGNCTVNGQDVCCA